MPKIGIGNVVEICGQRIHKIALVVNGMTDPYILLGNDFLLEQNLVIDYANMCVRPANIETSDQKVHRLFSVKDIPLRSTNVEEWLFSDYKPEINPDGTDKNPQSNNLKERVGLPTGTPSHPLLLLTREVEGAIRFGT
jgi:hypothetical protein